MRFLRELVYSVSQLRKKMSLVLNETICDELASKGYCILDNYLDEEHYQGLYHSANTLLSQDVFLRAKVGPSDSSVLHKEIRTDEIYWLDEVNNNPFVKAYLDKIHTLRQTLNQAFFLSMTEFESHFAIYQAGSFYKKHVDQFKTNNNRKISCVYYLNPQWDNSLGGMLKLYDTQEILLQEILPCKNRFVCFDSALPHEVTTAHQIRYSITGWIKTRPISDL